MAKTYRNLWPQVVSWENLLRAYRKCRRRKRYRQPATEFEFAWEENLLNLQRDLMSGEYEHGPYHHFHISDPKPRMISAAPFRDRVVHHAVVAVLEPIFERRFIHDSYACRVGKGTHRAIKRAQYYMRRHPWCLKTDIVKFFPSIDHEVLLRTIRRRVADPFLIKLIEKIVHSGVDLPNQPTLLTYYPGDDLFAVLRPRGLPIGNLTSQFFANVFLDPLDHFIKEELRIPGYIRYADDLLLFGDSKDMLWKAAELISEKLCDMRLRLHTRKTHLHRTDRAMTYLGFRVSRNELKLSQQGIRRFIRRARWHQQAFAVGGLGFFEISISLNAWRSHVRIANSKSLQQILFSEHLRFSRTSDREQSLCTAPSR